MKAPVENADVMDEAPFRVSVNLERFFSDERSRCYVSVSSRRRVRWLQRRLRRLFLLPRRVSLLLHDHLLPPDELLALLRPDDTVHVIPSEIDWAGSKQCVTQTIDMSISDVEETAQISKRKKYVQSIKNKMDISNNEILDGTGICDTIPFKVTDKSEMNMEDTAVSESQEMLMKVKNRALALLEDYEIEQSPNTSLEVPARRKRRRVRRRRVRPQPSDAEPSVAEPSDAEPSVAEPSDAESSVAEPSDTEPSVAEPSADPDQPAPLAPPPASSIPASQDENDSTSMTKHVCDSVELELQPPSQFVFCGVNMSVPVVVRNNSVTPREARIVHPLN